MSMNTKLKSPVKQVSETRRILGPGGNRVRATIEDQKSKNGGLKKLKPQQGTKKAVYNVPISAVRNDASVDSLGSSDSASSGSSAKLAKRDKVVKVVVPDGVESLGGGVVLENNLGDFKRCDWITPYSDPLYTYFHDEEWGVPVHDDRKLFELLVFSQALAELSWLAILNKRDIFRKLFDNFDLSLIAEYTDQKVMSLKVHGSLLLSEQKLRAIVENAKRILKIQQEFGSFSNYCWKFVNHKPIRNGFRYARQVPVKTPKAELISKDLMQRGFRCVGPTIVYSFMQVAGIVNDHLISCFRYQECNKVIGKELKTNTEEIEVLTETLGNTYLSHN